LQDADPIVNEALQFIGTTAPRDAGFVVIPEGIMLNSLTRGRNPARWFKFTPQTLQRSVNSE